MTTHDSTATPPPTPAQAPSYKVIKKVLDDEHDDGYGRRESWHIKLDKPQIVRAFTGNNNYADVEYVLVNTVRFHKQDARGEFSWEESNVTASDETGSAEQAYLYYNRRYLNLDEILFTIGVI